MEDKKVYSFKDFKFDAFMWKVKKAAGDAWYEIRAFCINNRELCVAAGPTLWFLIRRLAKAKDERREDRHREREVYDRALGMYHQLRRTMKPHERLEFEMRRKNKEPVVKILNDMRLL